VIPPPIKRGVLSLLHARGYDLKEVDGPPRGYEACLRYAKSRGLVPKTVFDVGVGDGTPWLYDAFPEAKLVLFEPLKVFDSDLDEIAKRHNADVHRVALADAPGRADLNRNVGHPTSSSLLHIDPKFAEYAVHVVQADHEYQPEGVELETLDRLNKYEPPYALKLDVEGAEMRVLEGARRTLQDTQFLLTEMSVLRRQSGEPEFAAMIHFLDELGFELFDIPNIAQAKHNGQLIYLDAAFVQKGSFLWP
jgi:FkbM family methyltransferase